MDEVHPDYALQSFAVYFDANPAKVLEHLVALDIQGRIYAVGADTRRVAPTLACVPIGLAFFWSLYRPVGAPCEPLRTPEGNWPSRPRTASG